MCPRFPIFIAIGSAAQWRVDISGILYFHTLRHNILTGLVYQVYFKINWLHAPDVATQFQLETGGGVAHFWTWSVLWLSWLLHPISISSCDLPYFDLLCVTCTNKCFNQWTKCSWRSKCNHYDEINYHTLLCPIVENQLYKSTYLNIVG